MSEENSKLLVSAGPHITGKVTTRMIMLMVTVALLPTLIASTVVFGPRVLLLTGVTVATCVAFEYLYEVIMKKPITIGDFSAVVTGLILAFNLPPEFPLWMATIGSFIAIVITKQLFGGLGYNFANPALVGRIVLQLSFTGPMIDYTYPANASIDALATATPLAVLSSGQRVPMMDLLLGTHGGTLGEACALTLLIGGLFLIATKVISAVIPATYLGFTFLLSIIFDFGGTAYNEGFSAAASNIGPSAYNALLGLMAGGLLLGAFFMATDYVTSPYTSKGKLIFGFGLALVTVAIRRWGNMAEGVSYSILLMNLLVPYINETCRQTPLGSEERRKKKKEAKKAKKGEA